MNNNRKSFTGRLAAMALAMAFVAPMVSAQDIYDDIYYNPKDDAKKKTVVVVPATQQQVQQSQSQVYMVTPASARRERSVDEYNRRGIFAADSIPTETAAADDETFEYTRRIERFYNPDVVVGSDDPTLAEVYYAEPANINIIVNTPLWCWTPYRSYYYPWGYSYPFGWGWGPSWSWSWGYDPYWSWGWGGPSWSWGWSWGAPGWGWAGAGWGPSWGWSHPRPYNPRHPGAFANHRRPGYDRPAGNRPGGGSGRPSHNGGLSGQRPSANPSTARPGSLSHGFTTGRHLSGSNVNRVVTGQRPGNKAVNSSQQTFTPSTGNVGVRPSYNPNGSGTRQPAYNTNNNNSGQRRNYNTNTNSYNTNRNTNTNRPSYSTGGSRHSGGFSGGGTRSGGGSRGGGGRGGRH